MRSLNFLFLALLCTACSYLPNETILPAGLEVQENAEYLYLKSKNIDKDSSVFVFYPGGFVDPHAYIESLRGIAEGGYPVIILKTDINLAVTNIKKGLKVVKDFPQVKHWVVGGHSLGGVMACYMLQDAKDVFEGLVLMGSYNDKNSNLSDWNSGAVLSLTASEDGLTIETAVENAKKFLPEAFTIQSVADIIGTGSKGKTLYYQIQGGNHGQFGNYGSQKGDNPASISPDAQHQQLWDFTLSFFINNGF